MKDRTEIRRDVNRGLSWVGLASALVSVLDLVAIIVILKFWISTEEYGIATKAVWMFPILDLATDLGLSAAVIQRDDHTERKISTVFWLNLAMGTLMFLGLWAAAPLMARFYGHAIVASMAVVYGTKLIWQNVYFIPAALMRRELRYKELSIIRVFANLAEFLAKVGSAAAGYGVWCFVIGPLCRVAVTGVGTQICHPWRPRFVLRLREAWDYAVFGLKASASQILFYFYTNVDYPIVGYYFGDHALGLYRWAYEVVLEPVRIISEVVKDVAFATFSRLKLARDKLVEQFLAFSRLNLLTVMSYLAFVVIVAEELNELLYGDKFAGSEAAIAVLSTVGLFRAMSYVVPPLLDGVGYPGRTLVYQGIAAVVLPAMFWASAALLGPRLGFLAVACAWAVGYPVAFAALALMGLTVLDMRARDYLRRVGGIPMCILAATAVGGVVHQAVAGYSPAFRFAAVLVALSLTLGSLLAYTQGITPRSIARAMRGETG